MTRSVESVLRLVLVTWLTGAVALAQGPDERATRAVPGRASNCAECHGREGTLAREGIHARAGITCVDCHGGDPASLDVEQAHGGEFRALSGARESVDHCAACHSDAEEMRAWGLHTDQFAAYRSSAHGHGLFEEGSEDVATCVSCHGSHDVRPATDPRSPVHKFRQAETCGACHADAAAMEAHSISSAVVAEYEGSVHGRALLERGVLGSPSCSDCHGSHGATPPRVESVGRVCGRCHSVEQAYFDEGPHLAATRAGAMDECLSCHGSHAVAAAQRTPRDSAGPAACSACHSGEDDPGLVSARAIYAGIHELEEAIEGGERALVEAAEVGLFLEQEHVFLEDARGMVERARTLTHACSPERQADLLARGHGMVEETHRGLEVKGRAVRDRKIFTALFLGVALLLAGVLQVYRREVYGGWKRRSDFPRRSNGEGASD